jgi:multiple sugar transport system permease protein
VAKTPLARKSGTRLWYAYFIIPGAIYVAALSFYPFVELIRMSLSQVSARNIVRGAWPFIGLQNFRDVFRLSDFAHSFYNTLIFVAIVVFIGMVGGLGAATILQARGLLSRIGLVMMVFIWSMPPVVLGSLWKFILLPQGLANAVITGLGLTARGPDWLVRENLVLVSVALVNSWAVIPFATMVYRAALVDIPGELLDAASVDGATRFQQYVYIKLPLLMPITLILTVLTVVYAFRSFDYIYVMTYGGPGTASTTMPFLSYRLSFVNFKYGLGATVAVFTILIVVALAIVFVRSTERTEEGA